MRFLLTIVLFFTSWVAVAQKQEGEVVQRVREFHALIVAGGPAIDQYIDDSLSYGHSNGWIENKKEFLSDLGKMIIYHAYREDSINVSVNNNVAHARFVADVDATLNGKRSQFHLRVLEVWVKNKKGWKLFARQAVK
jgi:ketosteroid isomerase-like protein